MSSVICFNLDRSKILSSGNGLRCVLILDMAFKSMGTIIEIPIFYSMVGEMNSKPLRQEAEESDSTNYVSLKLCYR